MMTKFEKLVFEMRQAFKDGFTRCYWRDKESLDKYNELERKVDEYLRTQKEAEQNEQPDLFGCEA